MSNRNYKDWQRILFNSNSKLQTLEVEELQLLTKSLINTPFNTVFKEYQIINRIPIVIEKVGAYQIANMLSGKVYINKSNEEGIFVDINPTRLLLPTVNGEYNINLKVDSQYKEVYDYNFLEDISTYQGWDRLVYTPIIGLNIDGYPLFKVLIKDNDIQILEYRGNPTSYLVPYNKYEIPKVFSKEITTVVSELSDSFISAGFKVIKENNNIYRVNPGIAYVKGIRINTLQPIFFRDITDSGYIKVSKEGNVFFENSTLTNNINYYFLETEQANLITNNNGEFLLGEDIINSITFTKSESIPIAYITNENITYLAKYKNINPINLIDRINKLEQDILLLSSKQGLSTNNRINNSLSLVNLLDSSDINHPLYTASYDSFENSVQNAISLSSEIISFPIPVDSNISLDNTTYKLTNRNFEYILPTVLSNGYIPIVSVAPIIEIYPKPFINDINNINIEVKGLNLREDYKVFVNDELIIDNLAPTTNKVLTVTIPNVSINDVITIKDINNVVYATKIISNSISLDRKDYIQQSFFIPDTQLVNSIEVELRSIDPYTYCELYIKDGEQFLTRVSTNLLTLGKNIIDLPNQIKLTRGSYTLIIASTALCSFGSVTGSNNQVLINDTNNLTNPFRTSINFNLLREIINPTYVNFSLDESANNLRTNNTNLEFNDINGWRELNIDTELSTSINPLQFRFRLDSNKPTINYKDYFIRRELTLDSGIWISKNLTVLPYTGVRLYIQGTFSRGNLKAYISSDKSKVWSELTLLEEQVVSLQNNIVNRVYEIKDLSSTLLLEDEGIRKRVNLSFRLDLQSLEGITKVNALGYLLNPQ